MLWTRDRDRLLSATFWALFAALSVISLVPLWSVRIPPMQDFWQHLALVDVIHSLDDPGSIYPDYFVLPSAPRPNLILYYGTNLVEYLVPLESAGKVVLSTYILTFPLAFLYLLRSFGKSRWLAFFCFPLVYNCMFAYGFVSFLLGMPLLLWGLGAYRRYVAPREDEPPLRFGIQAAVALLLAFFTHAHIYLMLSLLCGIVLVLHRHKLWGTALRAWPFVPALAFFVPWFVVYFLEQTPATSGMKFGSLETLFGPTFYKPSTILTSFFHYVGDYFQGEADDAIFVALMLVAMVLLMLRKAPEVPAGAGRKLARFDLEILTLVLMFSVLLLPQHIQAQSIVSLRHVVFTVLFFFGWLGFESAPKRVVVPAVAILVALHVASVLNLNAGFRAFEREIDVYPTLFDRTEGWKRLLKVAYNQESDVVNHGAFWHMHFFYALQKGGISDVQFAEYPHNPIQYRQGMVPPKPNIEKSPSEFFRSPDMRYFEYLLLRKGSSPSTKTVAESIELLADNREWALYRFTESPRPRPEDATVSPSGRRDPVDSREAR